MKGLVKRCLASPAVVRAASRGRRPRVLVLMYHDLREDGDFVNWLRIGASAFSRHLGFLKRVGTVIAPEAAAEPEALPADRLHFLLTFDDGYVNNLRLAAPILARHGVHAQFFISTAHMQDQQPFWSDVVTTPIQAEGLDALDLTEHGLGVFRFRQGNADARWQDIQALLVALKARGNEDDPLVAAVLDDLRRRHAATLARHLPRFRPLAPGEVAELAAGPWCRIGSHAHRHRILTRLDDAELARGLAESRRLLEEIVQGPVRELAYPNGDHDERVRRAAACAGYERAYTVAPGLLGSGTPSLARPRLGVGGTGPEWLPGFQITGELLRERSGGHS